MMSHKLEEVLLQIPGWTNATRRNVEQIAGLTNTNYRVEIDDASYVLRINGENTSGLGIDRECELEALERASKAGIAPEIVLVIEPEGHLVTRWIDGHHWTPEEYRKRESIALMVNTVKKLHSLPTIEGKFSPFDRVDLLVRTAKSYDVELPDSLESLLETAQLVKEDQEQDEIRRSVLCHNDLVTVNFLFSEETHRITLLDFEFAGMGDVYFDLATLVYAHDNVGSIPKNLEEYLLTCYFGKVDDFSRLRLSGMKFMLLFFYATWGLAQYGIQKAGLIPEVEGFDYREYAEYLISHDIQDCRTNYLSFKS
ncbi:MAG: hypothetical protein EAX95_05125 [Candidatus Thorarchaeota archaeon]|nr:hypothetical protein [Candidatus Thorarchaeota archaeon]